MRDRIFTIALAAIALLLSFSASAFAAGAVMPDDGSLLDLARPILAAVMSGQGFYAAALALVLCVAAARRYLPKWAPAKFGWLLSDAGTTAATFLMALGGAMATALSAGAVPTIAMAQIALGVAVAAAGGYQALKHLLAPLLRSLRDRAPAWSHPAFDLVLWVFAKPDPIATAETAGDAAVAAKPAAGAVAIVGKPREIP